MFNFRGRSSNNPQSNRDLQRFKNISFKQRHPVAPFEQKLFGPFDSDFFPNKTYFPGKFIINTQYPYESNWFINDEYNSKSINLSVNIPEPGIYKITRKDTFDGKFSVNETNVKDFNNIGASLVHTEVRQFNLDGSSYSSPYSENFAITAHSFQPRFKLKIDNPENILPVETENFISSKFATGELSPPSRRRYGNYYGIPDTEFLTLFRTNLGGDKVPGYIFGNNRNSIDIGQIYDMRFPTASFPNLRGRIKHWFKDNSSYVYDEVGLGNSFMYIHDGFNIDKLKAFKGEGILPYHLDTNIPRLSTYASPDLKICNIEYTPIYYPTAGPAYNVNYSFIDDNSANVNPNLTPLSSAIGQFFNNDVDNIPLSNSFKAEQISYTGKPLETDALGERYTFREPITANIPFTLSTIRMDGQFGGESLKSIEYKTSVRIEIPDNKLFQQRRNSIHTLYSVVSSLSNPLDSFYQLGDSRSVMFSSTPLSATHWVGNFKTPLSSADFEEGFSPYKSTVPLQEIKDKYFVLQNRTNTEATWNTHWWGYSARDLFNFSGVSFRVLTHTGRNNNDNNCTLITPRHGFTARHWYGGTGPAAGDIFLYYDHTTGAALTATVEAVDRNDDDDPLNGIDIEVVRFKEDMQAAGDIKIYKLPKITTFVREKTFPVILGGGNGIFGRLTGSSPCYWLDALGPVTPVSAYEYLDTPELSSNIPNFNPNGVGVGYIQNGSFEMALNNQTPDYTPFDPPQATDFYSKNYHDLVGKEYTSCYNGLSTLSSCFAGTKFGMPLKAISVGDSGTPSFIPLSAQSGFEILPVFMHLLPSFGGPYFGSPLVHEYLERAIERVGNSEGYTLSTIDLN